MERWPEALQPSECEFYLSFNNSMFVSPITRSEQILKRSGDRWVTSFNTPPLTRAQGQSLDALLARLRGVSGVIQLWDFARPTPAGADIEGGAEIEESRFTDSTGFTDGTAFSFGVVDGILAYGDHPRGMRELFTRGWQPGISGILLAGDYIEVGRNLLMITADADTDALGRSRLAFEPALRFAVTDGDTVTRTQAAAEMRLIDDDQSRRRVTIGNRYYYTLSFVEAL